MRDQLNILFSNPFVRLGTWLQRSLRGRKFGPPLPESLEDFEVVAFQTASDIIKLGAEGPFVLVAVACTE